MSEKKTEWASQGNQDGNESRQKLKINELLTHISTNNIKEITI